MIHCPELVWTSLTWVDDFLPLLFYALTIPAYWKLAHVRGTFPAWRLAWLLAATMAGFFTLGRLMAVAQLAGWTFGGWLYEIRNGLVLMAALAMLAHGWMCWRIYRAGATQGGAS